MEAAPYEVNKALTAPNLFFAFCSEILFRIFFLPPEVTFLKPRKEVA